MPQIHFDVLTNLYILRFLYVIILKLTCFFIFFVFKSQTIPSDCASAPHKMENSSCGTVSQPTRLNILNIKFNQIKLMMCIYLSLNTPNFIDSANTIGQNMCDCLSGLWSFISVHFYLDSSFITSSLVKNNFPKIRFWGILLQRNLLLLKIPYLNEHNVCLLHIHFMSLWAFISFHVFARHFITELAECACIFNPGCSDLFSEVTKWKFEIEHEIEHEEGIMN